jgi:hypothetical protein
MSSHDHVPEVCNEKAVISTPTTIANGDVKHTTIVMIDEEEKKIIRNIDLQ